MNIPTTDRVTKYDKRRDDERQANLAAKRKAAMRLALDENGNQCVVRPLKGREFRGRVSGDRNDKVLIQLDKGQTRTCFTSEVEMIRPPMLQGDWEEYVQLRDEQAKLES